MAHRFKKLIQLMLIVTMVVQPVALSYAMAGMDHSQHMSASVIVMEHHTDEHAAHGMAAKQLDDATQGDGASAMNDCCNSAACCPAAVLEISVLSHQPTGLYSFSTHSSWEGIALSAEVKPPRPLFS
jgi:hypothetical protein